MFDLHPENFLVPSKKARHRVPTTLAKVIQHRDVNQQKEN